MMRWLSRLRGRVPVYQQMDAAECGAVCLRMILGYWGRFVTAQELREECGIDRSGTSARTMLRVARDHGLRTSYLLRQEPADLATIECPAILHWKMSHFVVLEQCGKDNYTIVDPAAGRLRISAHELSKSFTGVVLLFEPAALFVRRPYAQAGITRYLGMLADFRALVAFAFVITLLLQVAGLTMAKLSQVILDEAIPSGDHSLLALIAILAGALAATQAATGYLRGRLLFYLRNQIDLDLNRSFVQHIFKLPFRFFEHRSTGDLLMRIGSNQIIRDLLSDRVLAVALDITLLAGSGLVMFLISPRLALVVIAAAMIRLAIVAATQSRQREMMQQTIATQSRMQSYAVEAFNSILSLKAGGNETAVNKKWNGLYATQLKAGMSLALFQLTVDTLLGALSIVIPAVILLTGAAQVIEQSMTVGAVIGFAAVAGTFTAPIWSLSSSWSSWQLASRHVERLTEVMDAEPEQSELRPTAMPISGRIELRNISFRYGREAPLVLKSINLSIAPGDYVAIVGPSGSGKSTLAKLLLGLYAPTEGEVLYDHCSIFDVHLPSLRSQIGIVMQEPRLFSGTIRENIGSHVSLEEVIAAARFAGIAADIDNLPLGYETLVAEGGTNFSGGQRQRIAIARAVLQRPAIVLFDEATSALDKVTEDEVYANMAALRSTRIVIAHRLSTVRHANAIIVLRDGHIVQYGAHDQLLAEPGVYRELVGAQC